MYIISLVFGENQDDHYFVRANKDGSWDEIYNPSFATQFEKKSEAQKWYQENTTFEEYAKVVSFQEATIKYDAWASSGCPRRSFEPINRDLARYYDSTKDAPNAVLDWRWKQVQGNEVQYKYYESWPELRSVFKHLWEVTGYINRCDDCVQHTITIFTKKDGDFETFKKEFDLIIDRITYVSDGWKVLPIFDHNLGEGGDFAELHFNPESGRAKVVESFYNNEKDQTLEEAFDYIRRERYYE